jgi:hypothetical protein
LANATYLLAENLSNLLDVLGNRQLVGLTRGLLSLLVGLVHRWWFGLLAAGVDVLL